MSIDVDLLDLPNLELLDEFEQAFIDQLRRVPRETYGPSDVTMVLRFLDRSLERSKVAVRDAAVAGYNRGLAEQRRSRRSFLSYLRGRP